MARKLRPSCVKFAGPGTNGASQRLSFRHLEDRQMLAAFDLPVISKTVEFRHSSIEPGIAAIQELGAANDFTVTATEDAAMFTAENLASYEAVLFLKTTGDVLDAAQESAFQQYIQNGGGWVGIHSASDTEYGWSWYGDLLGAYFQSHPSIQQATCTSLPRWTSPLTREALTASITWFHDFDGGRSWYTGLGYASETYSEPLFLDHILGGIQYAAGQIPLDGGATI